MCSKRSLKEKNWKKINPTSFLLERKSREKYRDAATCLLQSTLRDIGALLIVSNEMLLFYYYYYFVGQQEESKSECAVFGGIDSNIEDDGAASLL